MKKGEIWISGFWEGQHGVLIGNRVKPNLWECKYLIKVKDKEYAYDKGGKVTGNPFDTSYHTGEGQIIEDVFNKFYHVEEGIKIVSMPVSEFDTVFNSGIALYSENNS
jgi:hypothetical protein